METPINVLAVDNEPEFAELVASMLEREDDTITVTTATSGQEALSIIEERSTIECIVSDYDMPSMTGLELLEEIREVDPDLPFVLFTGKGSEEIASEAIAAGVTQYLQKKPGRERYTMLANQISNAVSQYRAQTELRESERRYERTLTTLHETTRDLMRAGTKEEIYTTAIETAGKILDIPIVTIYAFDPLDGALHLVASSGDVHEPGDGSATEGRHWETFSTGEASYVEDLRAREDGDEAETLSLSEVVVPMGTHGVFVAGAERVDGFDETMIELVHILAANVEAALDRAEREELLREHDRTLTRQNEELTRLNHTNEMVRDVNQALAKASTRTEIEQAVCRRLAEDDRYLFAWVTNGSDPDPAAWAGVDAAYVDLLREEGDTSPESALVREAFETEEVQVVANVLDEPAWEPRRREALTYGFQTVVAVPVVSERCHCVLVVHAPRIETVSESEREVVAELGVTIGHAIQSVERTRSLLTDDRTELELRCGDDRFLLNRLATAIDRPVTLEGLIERDDGTVLLFVTVEDLPADTLEEVCAEWATIETVSVVSEGDESSLVELTTASRRFFDLLIDHDASLRSAQANDGACTLVLDLPQRVEARQLIEAIQETYAETELTARRETTETQTPQTLDGTIRDRLTARQYEALQAAYYGGFFQWPRESTGEDLASVLDVSPPTYHYHLRAAERKLVETAFGDYTN